MEGGEWNYVALCVFHVEEQHVIDDFTGGRQALEVDLKSTSVFHEVVDVDRTDICRQRAEHVADGDLH